VWDQSAYDYVVLGSMVDNTQANAGYLAYQKTQMATPAGALEGPKVPWVLVSQGPEPEVLESLELVSGPKSSCPLAGQWSICIHCTVILHVSKKIAKKD
jgi:hypothetical protein